MTATKPIIKKAIEELGMAKGTICFHSSLKSFGNLEGGVQTLVDSFLEKESTLIVPSFTYQCAAYPPEGTQIEQNAYDDKYDLSDPVLFDPESDFVSPIMGTIPREIVKMERRVRGNHPLNSFTGIGPEAARIIPKQSYTDVYAPLRAMYEMENCWVLLAGVDLTAATPVHFAENLSGRRLFISWAKDKDGNTCEVRIGSCSGGFNQLQDSLKGLVREGRVGNSQWKAYPFKPFIDAIVAEIKKNPFITHCGDESCIRCRDAIKGGPIRKRQ